MEIKYTEEELNSIDKSLLIKMFLNLQNQMETLTVETKALNDKMQKMMGCNGVTCPGLQIFGRSGRWDMGALLNFV